MNRRFYVQVEKEHLIFSSAHFITIGDDICESLHGHNYRVACQVRGEVDQHACVIDFIWLRDQLKQITGTLDHRVLLPSKHPNISVATTNSEVEARYKDRRWVFPVNDVVLLPVDNTTAERLAEYIGSRLLETMNELSGVRAEQLSLGVDENEGQWAWCEFDL